MIFLFDSIRRIIGLSVRFPSAIAYGLGGVGRARTRIESLAKEKWFRKPVESRHTKGFDIYLDPKDDIVSPLIGVTGGFEPGVTWVFERTLKPRDTVVDVGANIGWHTLLAARLVGQDGQVLSFEPEPSKFQLLQKSVERNDLRNVRLFQQALSDVDGQKTMNLYEGGNRSLFSTNSSIKGAAFPTCSFPSSKLDTLAERELDQGRCVNLIKVDVNGGEPEVVSGMSGLIERGRILNMALEWNPGAWVEWGELLGLLREKFEFHLINTISYRGLKRLGGGALPQASANLFLALK